MGILSEVVTDFNAPLGDRVRRGLPTSLSSEAACGKLKTRKGNEERDGRNRPRILIGMGSRCRGGRASKASRGRHAGRT